MANLVIDLTYTNLKQKVDGVSTYTYKDIGTSNMKLLYKKQNNQEIPYLYDKNTSNTDLNAIKASLRNLFTIYPGQLVLDPAYGNRLHKYIYEPMTQITKSDIIRTIKQMITEYEPRIRLTHVTITPNDDKLEYYITIKYYIPKLGTNSSEILSLSSSDGITFQ